MAVDLRARRAGPFVNLNTAPGAGGVQTLLQSVRQNPLTPPTPAPNFGGSTPDQEDAGGGTTSPDANPNAGSGTATPSNTQGGHWETLPPQLNAAGQIVVPGKTQWVPDLRPPVPAQPRVPAQPNAANAPIGYDENGVPINLGTAHADYYEQIAQWRQGQLDLQTAQQKFTEATNNRDFAAQQHWAAVAAGLQQQQFGLSQTLGLGNLANNTAALMGRDANGQSTLERELGEANSRRADVATNLTRQGQAFNQEQQQRQEAIQLGQNPINYLEYAALHSGRPVDPNTTLGAALGRIQQTPGVEQFLNGQTTLPQPYGSPVPTPAAGQGSAAAAVSSPAAPAPAAVQGAAQAGANLLTSAPAPLDINSPLGQGLANVSALAGQSNPLIQGAGPGAKTLQASLQAPPDQGQPGPGPDQLPYPGGEPLPGGGHTTRTDGSYAGPDPGYELPPMPNPPGYRPGPYPYIAGGDNAINGAGSGFGAGSAERPGMATGFTADRPQQAPQAAGGATIGGAAVPQPRQSGALTFDEAKGLTGGTLPGALQTAYSGQAPALGAYASHPLGGVPLISQQARNALGAPDRAAETGLLQATGNSLGGDSSDLLNSGRRRSNPLAAPSNQRVGVA